MGHLVGAELLRLNALLLWVAGCVLLVGQALLLLLHEVGGAVKRSCERRLLLLLLLHEGGGAAQGSCKRRLLLLLPLLRGHKQVLLMVGPRGSSKWLAPLARLLLELHAALRLLEGH